jgi:hypothetical protein
MHGKHEKAVVKNWTILDQKSMEELFKIIVYSDINIQVRLLNLIQLQLTRNDTHAAR